jgi:membrane protease YdiL (CAAX protease family)
MEQADISLADGEPFRLRALPIAQTFFVGLGLLAISGLTLQLIEHFLHPVERPEMPWISYYYGHIIQLAYALGTIYLLRRTYPGSYGLQWPEGKSYVGWAILWGVGFGLLMTLVDYWPQIFTQTAPKDNPYPLTAFNIAGWLSFEGIFVGPSEEVLFRGLLVTFLTQRMPGKISYRGYEMNGAGVVVAAMFALAHAGNFFVHSPIMVVGQLIYAFALGVLYAYWLEKSKSLLAPIIGHNASDVTEQILIFVMVAAWSGHLA